MAAPITGWLAVSTQPTLWSTEPFLDAGYFRQAVAWTSSPAMNEQPRLLAGPDVVLGQHVRWAGIFDAPKDGYCILSYALLPDHVESPADVPPTTVMVAFDLPITQSLNYSMLHSCVSETVQIEKGQTLGKVNGRPLIARVRLLCSSGSLIRPGRVKGALQAVGASA
jgi:hypothetical protein